MEINIGRKNADTDIVRKDHVTAPARVNPLGATQSQRPTVKLRPAQLRNWADNCHDDQTEVLTSRGWLLFAKVDDDDLLMTYNRENGMLEFQQPEQLTLSWYEGPMHYFRSKQIDFAVTPNHRLLYQPVKMAVAVAVGVADGEVINLPWKEQRAEDLSVEVANIRFRVAGGWEGVGASHFMLPEVSYGNGRSGERGSSEGHHRSPLPPLPMHEWLKFLGYFISEGWSSSAQSKRYYVGMCNKDPEILDDMAAVCETLFGVRPKAKPKNGGNDGYDLNVYGKQLWSWLVDNVGVRAENKRIPRELLGLPPDYLRVLLDALMAGDGSWHPIPTRTSGTYYTASKGLANDVQELVIRLGWRACLSFRDRNIPNRQTEYLVSISRDRDTAMVSASRHRQIVDYAGMIYCASVPNGTLVTRRNGRAIIHLNSEWIRAAVNHRRRQVSQSEWSVVPVDSEASFDPQLEAAITLMFLHPNSRQKTFRELIEPAVEDVLVLDRGVIEKETNIRGLPIALHLVDGGTIRTKTQWSGEPNDPRYEWWPGGVFADNLLDSQIVLMMENPTSHRAVGLSPLEALRATIDADLEARDFNKRMVSQTSPNGILNLGENVPTNTVDSFRVYWDAEVAGNKQMAIVGGVKNPQFMSLGQTAREMQYMQWQIYLLRKIAAVFGIAPQDLGITFDVNRSSSTTQQELSEDRGLKPLLRLIEEQMNTKVLADFAQVKAKQLYSAGEIDMATMRMAMALTHVNPRDHTDIFRKLHSANILNLAFKFRLRSAKSTRDQADHNTKAVAGFPWRTINEVRSEDGFSPVEGGDQIVVMTPIGAMPLEMIGGQMEAQTDEQKQYLEGLFRAAPFILGGGTPVSGTPPVAVAAVPKDEPQPVIIETEVEVDEFGDPVED